MNTPALQTKTLVDNRQARHLYVIEDTFEAGVMLMGWEVKAIMAGQANFNGGAAYVRLEDGDAFLHDLTITPLANSDKGLLVERLPVRPRKLLLHKAELNKLSRKVSERGYTIVPLELTKTRKLKVVIGLAKGKKLVDKRAALKERDQTRETARAIKDL
ncbi:SsrA-binding protein SmpB [Nostoc sp. CHAB 5834]|nr:SsrA-binding protein SmpB [Nostoc sp. CHAB 5834]